MSKEGKRTRILATKQASTSITIREMMKSNGKGQEYLTHCVQGWKEDGKWQRRFFKCEKKAEAFASSKRIQLMNEGVERRMVLTTLDDERLSEAEAAFNKLKGTYSLAEAVEYFLNNHRPPEFTIDLDKARNIYLDQMERGGARPRTLQGKKSVLVRLSEFLGNLDVHSITQELVEAFLKSRESRDGGNASRKTWNNYRNELNHFFAWCAESDLNTHRPWTFRNPAEGISVFKAKQVADERGEIIITEAEAVTARLSRLMAYRNGALVKYYALAYFTGIRPDGELKKLSKKEKELINLDTKIIYIPSSISKTGHSRQVTISDNLKQWLAAYSERPIIPTNFNRMNAEFRKQEGITQDETRHTFISFHVAKFRSVGDTALQAGNSETMVRQHYLNMRTKGEGDTFFRIVPDMKQIKAALAAPNPEDHSNLKAI